MRLRSTRTTAIFTWEQPRPDTLQRGSAHGETRTDDGGASFDHRPHGADDGADERIPGFAAALEGGEAEDGGGEDEDAEPEDEGQADFLGAWEAERPDHEGQGGQDYDVGGDVVDGICEPEGGCADAGGLVGTVGDGRGIGGVGVPEVVDGCALEDGGEDGCNGVGGDDGKTAPAGAHKPGLGEDAEVEGQDREFGEVDGEFVEDLVEVEHL